MPLLLLKVICSTRLQKGLPLTFRIIAKIKCEVTFAAMI
jgi:hypothetical protein